MPARLLRAAPIRRACGNPDCAESRSSIEKPVEYGGVGIDATVAQKRPVAPDIFGAGRVALDHQNLFLIVRSFCDHLSKWIGHKGAAPEFETLVERPFESHAIYCRHIDAIGDGMSSLDGPPRIMLRGAVLLLLRRMPADGGGIEQNLPPPHPL